MTRPLRLAACSAWTCTLMTHATHPPVLARAGRTQRQQRTAELAFMSLLREAKPPLQGTATYEEASGRWQEEPAWQGVADLKRRRQLFVG